MHARIDQQQFASHMPGRVRQEKERGIRNVIGARCNAKRCFVFDHAHLVFEGVFVHRVLEPPCPDEAGADCIYANGRCQCARQDDPMPLTPAMDDVLSTVLDLWVV
jgi:hypothetical protein